MAYGDVTAIAMGPGVFPWQRQVASLDDSGSLDTRATLTYTRLNDEPLPRCGDGSGNIGAVTDARVCCLATVSFSVCVCVSVCVCA